MAWKRVATSIVAPIAPKNRASLRWRIAPEALSARGRELSPVEKLLASELRFPLNISLIGGLQPWGGRSVRHSDALRPPGLSSLRYATFPQVDLRPRPGWTWPVVSLCLLDVHKQ